MMLRSRISIYVAVLLLLFASLFTLNYQQEAHAAVGVTFTVNSTDDTGDSNIGDNDCDDGTGECTLRAAIQESNFNTDVDTIEFAITGAADFTIAGKNGYTIEPQTQLPSITKETIINGYSQPDTVVNTAVSPAPFNSRLLIELSGSSLSGNENGLMFIAGSDNSEVRGLIINQFPQDGIQLNDTNSIAIYGNYIGTDPTGLIDNGNESAGITHGPDLATDVLLGGSSPSQRNIISGNDDNAAYPLSGWIIKGNYVGVGSDGFTNVGNGDIVGQGSGAFSIDVAADVEVGGSEVGATNVISGNRNYGLAPDDVQNLVIQNNYIGVAADGVTPLPNTSVGIILSVATDAQIKGNVIMNNLRSGILIADSTGVVVGGLTEDDRNVISGNETSNIYIGSFSSPPVGVKVQGNYIGTDINGNLDPSIVQGAGITVSAKAVDTLIGGTEPGAGNRIAGNKGYGVGVTSMTAQILSITFSPDSTAIIGNEIYSNGTSSEFDPDVNGLGIDIFGSIDTSDPIDLVIDDYINVGPTLNDASDADTGPNNYMNFPVINSAVQNGDNLNVSFDLDAADSPTDEYRVDFYANNSADVSGYGEGQTHLGFVTVTNGTNTENINLPSGYSLSGKSIAATATAIDATNNWNFGSTSEFSAQVSPTVSAVDANTDTDAEAEGSLPTTGNNSQLLFSYAFSILIMGSVLALRYRRRFSFNPR